MLIDSSVMGGKMARRGGVAFPAILIIVGIVGIFELIDRPGHPTYRAVDVVQLVASGMCLGVALAWIIGAFRSGPTA